MRQSFPVFCGICSRIVYGCFISVVTFESTPQAKEMVSVLKSRIEKLNVCDYAGHIIEYFKDIRFTGYTNSDFMAVVSNYNITPDNGYNFR